MKILPKTLGRLTNNSSRGERPFARTTVNRDHKKRYKELGIPKTAQGKLLPRFSIIG